MRPSCAVAFAMSALVGVAHAQTTPERPSIVVLGGVSVAASHYWEAYQAAYSAGWDVPLDGPWGLRTTFGRVERLLQEEPHDTYNLDVTFLSVEGRWRPRQTESGVLGVLHAGVAAYHLQESHVFSYGPWSSTTESGDTQVGWTAGAALEFPLARPKWWVVWDGTYHRPGRDAPSFAVVSLGVSWRY